MRGRGGGLGRLGWGGPLVVAVGVLGVVDV